MSKNIKKLCELGEKKILHDLVFPICSTNSNIILGTGDDCAVFRPKRAGDVLAVTTDPCPIPVANIIGDDDFFNYGWLTVIINISDLGAMGAEPIGILISTIMPESMYVYEYENFLNGVLEASKKFNCPIIGGNIKDGKEFSASGCAFGSIKPDKIIQRSGGQIGDYVFVIGEMGIFWASVISFMKKFDIRQEYKKLTEQILKRPLPKLFEGIKLAQNGILNSCMDSSDGISSCLFSIAKASKIDITIELNSLKPCSFVEDIANKMQVDYRKLMFSWGGWELVGTLPPNKLIEAERIMKEFSTPFQIIGEVHPGNGSVWCKDKKKMGLLSDTGSYRFCDSSYFTKGIDSYLEFLISTPFYK